MALAHEDRQRLRQAVDEARRQRLMRFSAVHTGLELCAAVSMSGRACRNVARAGAYCYVHARSHGAAAA